ncbi:hypothetical protein [Phyllobacterium sp. SB3]|uniref:hypothetical protein n=1 Tax=Phyllobacterium sp. SB3 TaxID=3156073 RepID=UPI0032AEFCCD
MSAISLIIIVLGVAVSIFFTFGFIRGVHNAIAAIRSTKPAGQMPENGHWASIAIVFSLSIFVIAGIGYDYRFIYAGPLLVLVTAAGTALAFFIEKRPS